MSEVPLYQVLLLKLCFYSLSLSLTLTRSLSLTHTHSLSLSRSLTLSFSLPGASSEAGLLLARRPQGVLHPQPEREREFFIDNLQVRIHFIIVMIGWTGLAPWELKP